MGKLIQGNDMKKITFILSAALLLTLGVSSCMDDFDTVSYTHLTLPTTSRV